MMRACQYLAAGAVISSMAMMSAVVRAQGTSNAATAQALYDEAMSLMASGKYAEACPKLAESYRSDPAMGTQFRLAECYESNGQFASAWSTFHAVAAAARQAGNATREQTALRRAEAIATRVPKLTITVPPQAAAIAGFELKRNGVVVPPSEWNQALSVDPGEQRVTLTGPYITPWEHKLRVKEGTAQTIAVTGLEAILPTTPQSPVVQRPPVQQASQQRPPAQASTKQASTKQASAKQASTKQPSSQRPQAGPTRSSPAPRPQRASR